MNTYVLNEKLEVVPARMIDWAAQLDAGRRVAETTLPSGCWVSTVFLGLDHRYHPGPNGDRRPIVFETMVFAPLAPGEKYREDLDMERYCTWDEAFAGHFAMVARFTPRALPPMTS